MRAPHRTHRPDGDTTEGHVGNGRASTAGVTGSRAIVSPRLVVASSRGGHHPRPWTRSGTDHAERQGTTGRVAGTGDSTRLSALAHEGPDAD